MDWATVTGMSSAVIALCALGFSVWQGIQARKHNKLSYRPHLATQTNSHSEKGVYVVELVNNGLGPAIIQEFVVSVDQKRIAGDGADPIDKAMKIIFPDIPYKSTQTFLGNGYSMAAKERCTIVAVRFGGGKLPSQAAVQHAFDRCEMEISYKSFYGEVFCFSTGDDEKRKKHE